MFNNVISMLNPTAQPIKTNMLILLDTKDQRSTLWNLENIKTTIFLKSYRYYFKYVYIYKEKEHSSTLIDILMAQNILVMFSQTTTNEVYSCMLCFLDKKFVQALVENE